MLGFDTSTRATSVAVRLADGSTLQARDDPGPGEHPGHATRLLRLSDELLVRGGLRWSELQRIAVGIGPGRFTGLRVGVATARGLAQSLSIGVAGVSSLRALAEQALAARAAGRVLAVIDGLRGQVFALALLGEAAQPPRELALPAVLSPDELRDWVAGGGDAAGGRWLAVGDGALRYRAALQSAGAAVADERSPLHGVDARAICVIGERETAARAEQIVPDYRRQPDAEQRLCDSPAAGVSAAGGQLQGALP